MSRSDQQTARIMGRIGCSTLPQVSAVSDHDLAKVAAALEMAVGLFRLPERKCPVDHRAQARCSAMARFIASKSARLPTLSDPSVIPRPVSNRGSSPDPDGDRLTPIRLICPPTANVCNDIAIV